MNKETWSEEMCRMLEIPQNLLPERLLKPYETAGYLTDKPDNPGYITMPYVTDGKGIRYTYGGMSTAGALTKWFSEQFAPGVPFQKLDQMAGRIEPGSEGLLMLPYFMGERSPIWDSLARGTLLGLTLNHTKQEYFQKLLILF